MYNFILIVNDTNNDTTNYYIYTFVHREALVLFFLNYDYLLQYRKCEEI